jgi:hypothetical protein
LVGVFVAVFVGVLVGVLVGVFVEVFVGVLVGVLVGVFVGVFVGVLVGVLVGVFVGVFVGTFAGVLVGVLVGVFVPVFVGVLVGVSQAPKLCRAISSRAKSFPLFSRLRSMIWIMAELLAPEFQLVVNGCHSPEVEGAVKIPTWLPLIRNCNWAGDMKNQLATQAESW